MRAEENKAIVRRFFEELWNQRNLYTADEIISEDCITHQLRSGEDLHTDSRGPEEIKGHIQAWLCGFPDLAFEIEQVIAEGNLVVTRCNMRGTHSGDWLGVTPTNKAVTIRMITTHRIENSKIVEDWVLVEALGFFEQLGLLPNIEQIMHGASKPTMDRT